ncbi:MAG: AmmeMemoRadiSam system protein B [Acidimicrobiia bacterium]|nr:AmmeMemoRadiSam system protein B [Acidimicrobiia bacterium]
MTSIRPPAVAGTFYPADATALRALIDQCMDDSVAPEPGAPVPDALVVPHAGLVYSGPVAASAYRRLAPARADIGRVVLLGPSHHVPLRGLALSTARAWQTPLGTVPVHFPAGVLDLGPVGTSDRAHAPEHSLEVQLPFLQTVLDDFEIVPLLVGAADADEVATVIEHLWDGPDTVVVVSTDLSHYHPYERARELDARTAAAIVARRHADITADAACGAHPLRGLLRLADHKHLDVTSLDNRNSGDTAGDRSRVVGYGSFALT